MKLTLMCVKRFLYLLCLLFIFSSCRTKKVIESPNATVKLKGADVIQVFDSVKAREFDYNYLSAKASVSYTDKSGETNSFDVNIRMNRDSAIWISITPLLGIEVARVLIRPDSILILDRLHKTAMRRDYVYFEEWLKANVNYEMIQSVIVGNYFQYQEKEKIKSLYDEQPFLILSTLNKRRARRAAEEMDPNKPIIQDFWIDGNYRIAKSRISDDKKQRNIEATYSNFTEVDGKLFPNNIVVTVSAASPTIIKVDYSKIESADTLQMPFSVPAKYEEK
jgi:hypothetical protein